MVPLRLANTSTGTAIPKRRFHFSKIKPPKSSKSRQDFFENFRLFLELDARLRACPIRRPTAGVQGQSLIQEAEIREYVRYNNGWVKRVYTHTQVSLGGM